MSSEALYRCENMFHIGAYRECVDAADAVSNADAIEGAARDSFALRSRLALGERREVIETIDGMGDRGRAFRGIRALAVYEDACARGDDDARVKCADEASSAVGEEMRGTTRALQATILAREGRYAEALRACHGVSDLEVMAVAVSVLCAMDRPELAEKQAKAMQALDDDSTVAQLACAWAHCASGGKKIQDASYIYQELGDKYMWTPKLYNGSAVCSMMMGSYEDAERDLTEAVALDPKDPETLANLATCALRLGKPSSRFINAIRQLGVPCETLAKIDDFEARFDRAASTA